MEWLSNPTQIGRETPVEEVQEVFGNLFRSESPIDNALIQHGCRSDDQYIEHRNWVIQPITALDVIASHNRMRYGAPGPNQVSVGDCVRLERSYWLYCLWVFLYVVTDHDDGKRIVQC